MQGVLLQAIDHIINSAAKTNYMSGGKISVPIVFRGPNGAAAGVAAQHSQVGKVPVGTFHFLQLCQPCSTIPLPLPIQILLRLLGCTVRALFKD